jgi:hypothetical protein
MNWKLKFLFLVILAIPAFVGYPVTKFDAELLAGLSTGWIGYFLGVNGLILIIVGQAFWINAVAIAALITLPVVYVGGTVSYLIYLAGMGYESGQSAYSPHYLSLCVTMLTVIPLALSLIAVVPFHEFEHHLLQHDKGVSKMEKFFLMFLRVFNHIVYFVIPNIIETMREEGQYKYRVKNTVTGPAQSSEGGLVRTLKLKVTGLIRDMIQLGVEGICASIQYIPLWAVEISQLPGKREENPSE